MNLTLAERKAAGPPTLTYLSLGAGVQSTTLALLAEHGELPRPDLAIFADTQWEPSAVYRHLAWLEGVLSFPVVHVTAGNLREHVIAGAKVRDRPDGTPRDPYRGIPVYTRGPTPTGKGPVVPVGGMFDVLAGEAVAENNHLGMARRQCTREYKITPITAEVKRRLGLEPGQRVPGETWVRQWTGISSDEAHRAKPAEERWMSREYPLLELGWTRMRCLRWLRESGFPEPPKSACVGCPFHGRAEWRRTRNNAEEWADAVEVDEAIRGSIDGLDAHSCFLHYSGRPLVDAVPATPEEVGQGDLFDGFGNECEGVCGV